MLKMILDKFLAQFLALPQIVQGVIGALLVGVVILLWPNGDSKLPAPVVEPVANAVAPVAAPKAPVTPKIADKQVAAPAGTTAITKLKLVAALPIGVVSDAGLKAQIDNAYQAQFNFPLTEEKMVRFAEAALQVENTNRRWDLQIAAAENDAMAIEYLKMSRAESVKAVQSVQGITMDEYMAIYNLTAQDNDFNQIAIAYKKLVAAEQKKQKANNSTTAAPTTEPLAPPAAVPQKTPQP